MRWQGREQSDNVEDRRGMPVGGGVAMGGGLGMVVLALIVMFLGGDPRQLLQQAQQPGGPGQPQANQQVIAQQKELEQFVRVVLKDTEDVWTSLTPEMRQITKSRNFVYEEPVLVLFSGRVNSACGLANAAVGPFYCPADHKVYLDLEFFAELQQRFKAPGDFAMAYVVAHEVGHHVQSLLGISEQVQRQQAQSSKVEGNQLSVRLELQADYLAGVWAARNQKLKNVLEAGDLKEALNAATRIGDDILQRQATGTVRPDAFTHGTARQREKWLRLGIETGDLSRLMDPFEVDYDAL